MSRRKPGGYSKGVLQTTRYEWDIVVDGAAVRSFHGTGACDDAHSYRSNYGATAVVKRRTVPIRDPLDDIRAQRAARDAAKSAATPRTPMLDDATARTKAIEACAAICDHVAAGEARVGHADGAVAARDCATLIRDLLRKGGAR